MPLISQNSAFQDVKAWPAWLMLSTFWIVLCAVTCPVYFVESTFAAYMELRHGIPEGDKLDVKAND